MFNAFQTFKEAVLMPIVRRIASNAATGSVAYGVATSDVATIEAALLIVGGIFVDLILSGKDRAEHRQ